MTWGSTPVMSVSAAVTIHTLATIELVSTPPQRPGTSHQVAYCSHTLSSSSTLSSSTQPAGRDCDVPYDCSLAKLAPGWLSSRGVV